MAADFGYKEHVKQLLERPENATCADCGQEERLWASTNLGVFVCIVCSGIHRNLGVHISKVRSVQLDKWPKEEYESMESRGNAVGNAEFYAQMPLYYPKVTVASSLALREQWIVAKYQRRLWTADAEQTPANTAAAVAADGFVRMPEMAGELTKKGSVVKNWKRRYFKLDGTRLYYFKSAELCAQDAEATGSVDLRSVSNVDFLPDNAEKGKKHCIQLTTPDRQWVLQGADKWECFEWIQALRYAIALCVTGVPGGDAAPDARSMIKPAHDTISAKRTLGSGSSVYKTFLCQQLVDFVMPNLRCSSREAALKICKEYNRNGLVKPVQPATAAFEDKNSTIFMFEVSE